MKSHVVIAAALAALAGCTTQSHPWEGLLYPKTGSLPYDIAIGHFASLDECRASAKALLSKMTPEPGATPDYECGYKCKIADEPPPAPGLLAMRLCERTEK
jgi:hypothetical protein